MGRAAGQYETIKTIENVVMAKRYDMVWHGDGGGDIGKVQRHFNEMQCNIYITYIT